MTKGKFTENCANLGSLVVNHTDNLTVKRVIVSIIYFDMIRASINGILDYRRNSIVNMIQIIYIWIQYLE